MATHTAQARVVSIIDNDDVSVDELVAAQVAYVHGRNDNWQKPPDEIRYR